MKKVALFFIELIFSILIIGIILLVVDINKVIKSMMDCNLYFYGAAFLCYFMIAMTMAFRIKYILQEMGYRISLRSASMANFAGLLASDFTPARSGYLITPLILHATEGIPVDKGTVTVLAPQLFEFMLKVGAGSVAIGYIIMTLNLGWGSIFGMLLGVGGMMGMILFGYLLLFSKRFLVLLKILEELPFLGKHLYDILHKMQESARLVKPLIPLIIFLLFFGWLFKASEWVLIAYALNLNPHTTLPPIIFYGFLQPLITTLQFVPSPTLAGIGLSEAGIAAILLFFGVPPHQAVAFSLLTRVDTIIIDMVGLNQLRMVFRKSMKKALAFL